MALGSIKTFLKMADQQHRSTANRRFYCFETEGGGGGEGEPRGKYTPFTIMAVATNK